MKSRYPANSHYDKHHFSMTARNTKAVNLGYFTYRGGIRF